MTRVETPLPIRARLLCADLHGRGLHADATLIALGRPDRGSVGVIERVVRERAANDVRTEPMQVAG